MTSFLLLKQQLLNIARKAIDFGLDGDKYIPDLNRLPKELSEKRATFVTLRERNSLRGCIGSLEPLQAIALDVAENAVRAAFHDYRFLPLTKDEWLHTDLSISVLTLPAHRMVSNREELISLLERERPGLILSSGQRRSTFLPSVWESLQEPTEFLEALLRKGGFAAETNISELNLYTYTAEELK